MRNATSIAGGVLVAAAIALLIWTVAGLAVAALVPGNLGMTEALLSLGLTLLIVGPLYAVGRWLGRRGDALREPAP